MKQSILLALTLFLVIGFSACSDFEEGPAFSLSSKNARLCKEWKAVKMFGQTPAVETIWIFEKDGNYKVTYDGNENVNPAEWSFTDTDALVIHYIEDNIFDTFTVKRLASDELKLYRNAGPALVEYEFVKN